MQPKKVEGGQDYHVHHSYVWLGSLRPVLSIVFAMIVGFAPALIRIAIEGAGEEALLDTMIGFGVAAIFCAVALIVVIAYQILSYRYLYFRISDSEFSLFKGIFNKKQVHVPYYRVQSVDQRAGLLQRIFGVCTVMIDTAGGSSNKAIVVPYLTKEQAEWLRVELFAHKRSAQSSGAGAGVAAAALNQQASAAAARMGQGNVLDRGAALWDDLGGVFAGADVDTGHVSYEYGMSNKELLLTGLSNSTSFMLIISAIFGGVSQLATLAADYGIVHAELTLQVLVEQAMGYIALGFFAFIAGAVFLILLIFWGISTVGTCLGYGGFRARRRDNRIETERGLLQHAFQGVDVDRIQAIVVKQTFIRRLLGYCELSLAKVDAVTAEEESQKKSGMDTGIVIHPFVKVDRIPQILDSLLPEYHVTSGGFVNMPPVALRRMLFRRCVWKGVGFWFALLTALLVYLTNVFIGPEGLAILFECSVERGSYLLACFNYMSYALYAIAAIATVLAAVSSVLWYRESGFACDERFMRLTLSGFFKVTYIFPRQKIQYGKLRSNPFQRRVKTTSLYVRTAAGIGGTTVRLLDASQKDACAWLDWLEPRPRS